MVRLLGFLGARATWVLFLGVFIGLLFPFLSSLMRPLLGPAVAALLFATLLRIDWRTLVDHARRPFVTLILIAWLLVASPVIVWLMMIRQKLTGGSPQPSARISSSPDSMMRR